MIKNIIFDFGGVLLDWDPKILYSKVFEDTQEMEYFLSEVCPYSWNIKQDEGREFDEALKERIDLFPQYTSEIYQYYSRWIEMIKGPVQGTPETLTKLHIKGFPLYGLTNWSHQTFPLVKDRYHFFSYFKGIVVSGEEKCIKPNDKIYTILLERYRLEASECLFIDDNKENILAADKLGFNTIHFVHNDQLVEDLAHYNIQAT